jgi:ATP-binding cassette subfamily B protein
MLAGFTIGALMTISGQITIGAYIAYAGMLIWIIWPMRGLGRLIVQMSEGLVSYQRIVDIIRIEEESLALGYSADDQHLDGEIRFQEVGFSYSDGRPALRNISIEIPPGSSLAIIGSTGSGKTSMVNLIPRFYDYSSGSITVDGRELRDYSQGYLRDQIGIVEQEPFLFSRSIRDNIRLGVKRNVSESEVIEVAKAAAIHDDIQGFPQGYDTQIGEKGVTLSGGQKQRLAIARTLLKDPSILILDDSTSSVDTVTEQEIRQALELLMQGRTTLIISHRVQSAMGADKIIVLQNGTILQRGTHPELLKEEGTYQEIYRLQTEMEDALEKELTDG